MRVKTFFKPLLFCGCFLRQHCDRSVLSFFLHLRGKRRWRKMSPMVDKPYHWSTSWMSWAHQHTSSICRWHLIWKVSSVFMSATKRVYVRAEQTLSVLGTCVLCCWYWENCNSIFKQTLRCRLLADFNEVFSVFFHNGQHFQTHYIVLIFIARYLAPQILRNCRKKYEKSKNRRKS